MAMEAARAVRVVLEASLLLQASPAAAPSGGGGAVGLRPGAEALLRRLRYSNLGVVLCHFEDMPTPESGFLKKIADLYSFSCMSLHAPAGNCSLNELMLEWPRTSSCFYVTSRADEAWFSELQNNKWRVICLGIQKCCTRDTGVLSIRKLEELLLTVTGLIKKEIGDASVLMVGYVMKPSREEDFAKRGAFPSYPTKNGLVFVPLSFELPLASQLQEIDIVLHKVTDEILSIDTSCSLDFPNGISFSTGMSELARFMQEHPDFCVIDPFKNIYPVLDRLQIQQILLRLQELATEGRSKLRAPHSLKLFLMSTALAVHLLAIDFIEMDNFHDTDLQKRLAEANLFFPLIVKPQVACGVADAHNMALVFKIEEFNNLPVPLPAILQEYVDHGSKMFKFYVIGDKVFHAVKNSMPNASFLKSKSGGEPLMFNSLKSLPVATMEQLRMESSQDKVQSLDSDLVDEAAKWLKSLLGLTIFGFDVVVQEGSGDHVIVDLNYLPSFKEVPDSDAMPAFWDAIKSAYESKKSNRGLP